MDKEERAFYNLVDKNRELLKFVLNNENARKYLIFQKEFDHLAVSNPKKLMEVVPLLLQVLNEHKNSPKEMSKPQRGEDHV